MDAEVERGVRTGTERSANGPSDTALRSAPGAWSTVGARGSVRCSERASIAVGVAAPDVIGEVAFDPMKRRPSGVDGAEKTITSASSGDVYESSGASAGDSGVSVSVSDDEPVSMPNG